MTKNLKKFTADFLNFLIFLKSKTTIYLSLGLHKGFHANTEAFSPQKEHPALQNIQFLNFFLLFWAFFALWIRIWISNPEQLT
jgi:hypothetical protein